LRQKLSNNKNFCWVARLISPSQVSAVQALKIEGVYLIKEPKRFYPNQNLAGAILGLLVLMPPAWKESS
jgi:cell division protein FtsI (penicillin-binding protein 3)